MGLPPNILITDEIVSERIKYMLSDSCKKDINILNGNNHCKLRTQMLCEFFELQKRWSLIVNLSKPPV
jgi:hypothetical protein